MLAGVGVNDSGLELLSFRAEEEGASSQDRFVILAAERHHSGHLFRVETIMRTLETIGCPGEVRPPQTILLL
jgi:hypothetical protein